MSIQKGFAPIILILGLVVILGVIGSVYWYYQVQYKVSTTSTPEQTSHLQQYTSTSASVNKEIAENDEIKKSIVNSIVSLIKQYYAQKGSYPKALIDLRTTFNITDSELKLYTNPPFYFTSDGTSYEYSVNLNSGEKFTGNTVGINKNLDASVQVQVNSIGTSVSYYFAVMGRLPKNLQEISTLPNYPFNLVNNPITNKPYTYIPKSDGSSFVVSGTLSNRTEYKKEMPTH